MPYVVGWRYYWLSTTAHVAEVNEHDMSMGAYWLPWSPRHTLWLKTGHGEDQM